MFTELQRAIGAGDAVAARRRLRGRHALGSGCDERPDLDLVVSGVGDSDPAVTENEDDPDTFAANRRVEIAYAG